MIKELFDKKSERRAQSGKFSISSVGQCFKKKYYEIKGLFKEDFDANTLRTFAIGDMFHRQACKEILEKGYLCGLEVISAEVNIPEQKYISGRADLLLSDIKTGEKVVVDIKSCSDYVLDHVQKNQVPEHYQDQVNLYLHFFNLKRGFLLFISKHKGIVEEFEVKYDAERAKAKVAEIEDFMINNVNKGIEPARCDAFISPWGCPVCDANADKQEVDLSKWSQV